MHKERAKYIPLVLRLHKDFILFHLYSEMQPDHRVKVYIEKPDEKDCFHSAVCYLPDYTWEDVSGFTPAEIDRYQKFLESTAHLILQFSQEGGVENAAGF